MHKRTALLQWMMIGIAAGFTGCARIPVERPVRATGRLTGRTVDGASVHLDMVCDGGSIRGSGTLDGRPFVLSGLRRWEGPAVLIFDEGRLSQGRVSVLNGGDTVLLDGFGTDEIALRRKGPCPTPSATPYQGTFACRTPLAVTLHLTQAGKLIAGTGLHSGRSFAAIGRVTGSHTATGDLLFDDGNRLGMKAVLHADGRALAVKGFGKPLVLKKQ